MAILKDVLVQGIGRIVGKLFLSADPTSDLEAATKHYVDQAIDSEAATSDSTYVKRSGDTMTGTLTLKADPTANLQAATKQYVDGKTLWYSGSAANSIQTIASFSSGTLAVAEGNNSHAEGEASHSEGGGTYATKQYAHAEGSGTNATGKWSHSEGGGSTASGDGAHAEGQGTTASGVGAHSEGGGSKANGTSSHAEGQSTTASAQAAHAEGAGTTASGQGAHAEGQNTTASASSAHAEGSNTTASGSNSHSEGDGTIANHASQHVFGEYNVADPSTASASSRGTYVEIVGNGTSSTRSNVRTLDWNGNEWIAGSQSASDVLLPLTSGSNTRSSLVTFINNIASRQNADYKIIEMTANATSSSTYAKYPYQYTVTWATATADTWVDGAVLSGDYDGDWAVVTANGSVTMYFEENPTATFGLIIEDAHIGAITGVTDYNTMLNMTQTGTYPDTTLLRQMCLNFQDGCSTLASAITDAGVTTAGNASPTVMATNIGTVATEKYAEGHDDGWWECVYDIDIRPTHIATGTHKAAVTINNAWGINLTKRKINRHVSFLYILSDSGASATISASPTLSISSIENGEGATTITVTKISEASKLSEVDTSYKSFYTESIYRVTVDYDGSLVEYNADDPTTYIKIPLVVNYSATNHSAVWTYTRIAESPNSEWLEPEESGESPIVITG